MAGGFRSHAAQHAFFVAEFRSTGLFARHSGWIEHVFTAENDRTTDNRSSHGPTGAVNAGDDAGVLRFYLDICTQRPCSLLGDQQLYPYRDSVFFQRVGRARRLTEANHGFIQKKTLNWRF